MRLEKTEQKKIVTEIIYGNVNETKQNGLEPIHSFLLCKAETAPRETRSSSFVVCCDIYTRGEGKFFKLCICEMVFDKVKEETTVFINTTSLKSIYFYNDRKKKIFTVFN